MYRRGDFAFNHRQDLHDNRIGTIWFDLLLPKSKPITIGVCYKNIDFWGHFESCISNIRSDCEIMILGDINVNFFEQNCSLFKNYKSILDLFNFKQLIKNSTRITDTSSTLIDDVILKVVFMDQSAMRISRRQGCVRLYLGNGGCKGLATNTLLVQLLNGKFLYKIYN